MVMSGLESQETEKLMSWEEGKLKKVLAYISRKRGGAYLEDITESTSLSKTSVCLALFYLDRLGAVGHRWENSVEKGQSKTVRCNYITDTGRDLLKIYAKK